MGTGICSLNRSVGLCEQVKSCGIVVGYEAGIGRNGKAVGAIHEGEAGDVLVAAGGCRHVDDAVVGNREADHHVGGRVFFHVLFFLRKTFVDNSFLTQ